MQSPKHTGKKVFQWTTSDAYARANACYLVAAYGVVCLGKSPEEASEPLKGVSPPLLPFRDASYNNTCEYQLTVQGVARGLSQGLLHGWLNLSSFDLVEYEHYERVENGDLNWTLPGKFISFAGPHHEHKWDNGYPLLAPEDYFDYFKKGGITDIIRLNNPLYDKDRFVNAGFTHHDLFFVDGSIPPPAILKKFMGIAEKAKGGIAIHCKAGLGRTGTLIACYMMKHYMLTATECIAWLRVSRPGSVLGPQQFFLEDVQAEMWKQGEAIGVRRKVFGSEDAGVAAAELEGMSLGKVGRVYAAPESTAPVGVQQGDYLNQQKARRQAGGAGNGRVVTV